MKKYYLLLIIILLIVFLFIFWPKHHIAIVQIDDYIFKVDIADDREEIIRGLSGHTILAKDEAMLFIYPESVNLSFWMKDMTFAIDLLWINNNKIIAYERNMSIPEPGTITNDLKQYLSPGPVDRVLEIPAGSIERLGIKEGDIINIDI